MAALVLLIAGCGGDDAEESDGPQALNATSGTFSLAAVGDIGMKRSGRATLAAMARARPDAYLAVGDLSYAGPQSERSFCRLVSSRVGERAPFAVLAGNHEEDSGDDGQIREFAECLPDRVGAVGNYGVQYYFDVGRLARFVMLSPDLTIADQHYYYGPDDAGGDTPQFAWFKEAISSARDEGIEWVIVGMHKPCITVGEYYCDVYQDLFNTLIEERVDLVISGHDHSYQRSKQVSTSAGCRQVTVDDFDGDCVSDDGRSVRKGNGPIFVIAGTGGAEMYPVHADDPEAGYFTATMGRNTGGNRSGFVELEISPDRLSGRFVGSTRGTFTDSFSIER